MARRKSMRSQLHRAARDLGNVEATSKGPAAYGKRMVRRKVYRSANRGLGKLLRVLGFLPGSALRGQEDWSSIVLGAPPGVRPDGGVWVTLIELNGPAGIDLDPSDLRLKRLYDRLHGPHGATVLAGGRHVRVRLGVGPGDGATTPEGAALAGRTIVVAAMSAVGLDGWTVISLEAHAYAELEGEGA